MGCVLSAHTPGPWAQDVYGSINDKTGNTIRVEGLALSSGSEAKANARLIAAAPELLEALKEYIAAGENSVTATDDVAAMIRFGEADKAARSAIAKATGVAV